MLREIRPQGYNFFMLNSAEHKIVNALKYENIKQFIFFSGANKHRMLFFLLINVKMLAIVGILTFMSRKISCLDELGIKNFYNLGIRLAL